ncbi:MAG: thiamine-phosphate kinase [Leptospiraceae bacterium]|nr:thiamine-phosphate kinase [Leptospiraceae bacterium]MCZ8346880.1 thiamine-phosphate kinase [Leptospiraceae bacterium]
MKEEEIIQLFANPSESMLDDCHHFDRNKLVTTDSLSEGTHFRLDWSSPEDIAIKLIEVNVSDIFSSGGKPKFCLLNLGLSQESRQNSWITVFSHAFRDRLSLYGIKLVGGDTFSSKITQLTLTLFGELPSDRLVWSRDKAKLGDIVYLTGSVGLSQLGYKKLKASDTLKQNSKPMENSQDQNPSLFEEAIKSHLRPESVYSKLYESFRNIKINSAMDITDGLFQDSWKLAKASKTHIQIHLDKLPRLDEYLNYLSLDEILSSGEELQLLFTSKEKLPEVLNGIAITEIGRLSATDQQAKVEFLFKNKMYQPSYLGFEHF